MNVQYKLNKKCKICGKLLTDKNISGYCNSHRDRTGKNNSFYGKTHNKEMIEKTKVKLRKISEELWKDETYKNKVILGVSKPRREGFKEEQSKRITQWYMDNPIQKEIRSSAMAVNWEIGNITKSGYSCNESKIERQFFKDVKQIFPNIIKKTIRANDRWFFPDIVEEELKIIIEFYGNFWHRNPKMFLPEDISCNNLASKEIWEKDNIRQKELEMLGYTVYIVWEEDYKQDRQTVLEHIRNIS